jgi:uncharacterized membrane protein
MVWKFNSEKHWKITKAFYQILLTTYFTSGLIILGIGIGNFLSINSFSNLITGNYGLNITIEKMTKNESLLFTSTLFAEYIKALTYSFIGVMLLLYSGLMSYESKELNRKKVIIQNIKKPSHQIQIPRHG